jgi:hypothetical protein
MAMRTITSLYDTYDDAVRTVEDLEAAGIPATTSALSPIAARAPRLLRSRSRATRQAVLPPVPPSAPRSAPAPSC